MTKMSVMNMVKDAVYGTEMHSTSVRRRIGYYIEIPR